MSTMSAYERGDFPPHWGPPPRIGYGERQPPILEVVETLLTIDAKPWVIDLFLEKLRSRAGHSYATFNFFHAMEDDRLDRYLTLLERLPPDTPLMPAWREAFEELAKDENTPQAQQARLRALLERSSHGG